MRLAVCVATFRRPEGLGRLLDGLAALEEPAAGAVSVVVVDNDPELSARAVVEAARARLPWPVRYLAEPRQGVSFARNAALDVTADQDFVVFIDDDETPTPAWLRELLACQRETGAAAVCGPVLPRFEPTAPVWITAAFRLCYLQPPPDRPLVEIATGNLLLARRALDAHGLRFDESVALIGGEDTLLGQQLVACGEQIGWAEHATVHELVPASRARLPWLLGRWYRTGNIEAMLAMRTRQGMAGRLAGLVGGLLRVGLGAGALAMSLPSFAFGERQPTLRRLYTVCRGLGMVASVFGRHREEYRTVHGA